MVQPARLERATSSFAGRRSNPTELRLQKCSWSIANYDDIARKIHESVIPKIKMTLLERIPKNPLLATLSSKVIQRQPFTTKIL